MSSAKLTKETFGVNIRGADAHDENVLGVIHVWLAISFCSWIIAQPAPAGTAVVTHRESQATDIDAPASYCGVEDHADDERDSEEKGAEDVANGEQSKCTSWLAESSRSSGFQAPWPPRGLSRPAGVTHVADPGPLRPAASP